MTRGGREKDRETPERRCIVTGETQPKAGLIRFVAGPDGQVVPDLAEKLPGRGFWVVADRAALDKAAAKGLFSRGAKAQVSAPPDLLEMIETGLARRVTDTLSLARKAGLAVARAITPTKARRPTKSFLLRMLIGDLQALRWKAW